MEFKSSIRNTYNSKAEVLKRSIREFNNEIDRWKRIYDDNKKLRVQMVEIATLGKALNAAVDKGDYDQCVIIANDSPVAIKPGWNFINR